MSRRLFATTLWDFNPRTHVGCDDDGQNINGRAQEFQSTHPRGVRRPALRRQGGKGEISIHAPTWGATSGVSAIGNNIRIFQSTHPRGVRRSRGCGDTRRSDISIHAPTWGATRLVKGGLQSFKFQSTHPRGVRRRRCPSVSITGSDFNPRTHVGCDFIRSIQEWWASNFNPRTHVGCDLVWARLC